MSFRSSLLALSMSLAWACARSQPTGPLTELEPKTASLRPLDVQSHYENAVGTSNAASEGVVDGQRLTDLPLLRPGEVLETVPGMVVTQHSGDGKANQYWLRGYDLDHGTDFASFIDGVPVNMPTNAHGQGYTDLNYLIPELVQSIRYRKGPYFAENGDFSSAGSAHIQYRSSLDSGIAAVNLGAFGYRRTLLADSFNLNGEKFAASAGLGMQRLGPTLLYALELEETNGPWVTPENLHKTNALLRLSDGSRAKGWSIDASFYSAHWNSTDQVPLSLIESGQLCRYCALDPSDGGTTRRAIVSSEWHSMDSSGYTRLSAYAQRYHLQLWSDFRFFENNPVTMDQFSQWEDRNVLGGQINRGWNHPLFGRESTTEIGANLRYDNIHVGLLNTQNRVALSAVDSDKVGEAMLGLYAQNSTQWNAWLRSVVGLQMDSVTMNLVSSVVPENQGSAHAAKEQPKLSLVFGPWDKTEFFINAGTGFHSNDARGVINKIDPTSLSVAGSSGPTPAAAVPALVGSHGAEVGLRSELIPGLQTSLALWRLNSDSELVYSADADNGSTSPNGASRRYGLEWNNNLAFSRSLLIDANLAWTHARFARMDDNGAMGDLIPNAVAKTALVAATWRSGTWSGGINWRYIGPYPLTQDGAQTAQESIVTNLRLQRALTPQLDLSVDVLNLFNRQYYDIAYSQDYQTSPDTRTLNLNGITVHPGEPRQLRVGLRMRF